MTDTSRAEALRAAVERTARLESRLLAAVARAEAAEARVAELEAERDAALRLGYRIGFTNSGEGWNGEWPFEGKDVEQDADWIGQREEHLVSFLGTRGEQ